MNIAEIQKSLDVSKTAYDEAEYNYEEAIVDFIKAFLQEHNGEYNFDTSCIISVKDGENITEAEIASIYIDEIEGEDVMVDIFNDCINIRSLYIKDMENIVNELMLEIKDEEEI